MSWQTMVDQLVKSSSTPLLQRILDDTHKLRQWSVERRDYAAMAFFDVAIKTISIELKKRDQK